MIIKLKVIKATPPSWYHDQIGKTFYADNKVDKHGYIIHNSGFGVEYRTMFHIDNIEVLEGELDKSGYTEVK